MTNDANKISREIAKVKLQCQTIEIVWSMNDRDGDCEVIHDEIVKLRDQCDLLLSPEYLGAEPQPLTVDQLKDIAEQLSGEAACIGAALYCGKLDDARLSVECLRDELNKLNLPKASEVEDVNKPLVRQIMREWLAHDMSDISETYWCAGWLHGLEYTLWDAVIGLPHNPLGKDISTRRIERLGKVAAIIGEWIVYGENGPEPVALDAWKRLFSNWKQQKASS